MATVREETAADVDSVRAVTEAAFGRRREARLVGALRRRADYVGLVAVLGGEVIGHIAFSGAQLVDGIEPHPISALGPMAVAPGRQRQGAGSALVRAGLEACRRNGHEIVVVLGHPVFYPRFGFVPAQPLGIACEYPVPDEAFMLIELRPGALRGRRGVVRYAPEFALAPD